MSRETSHARNIGSPEGEVGIPPPGYRLPAALFLSAGGYHHHVGTNTWAGDAPSAGPDDAGLISWTLVVPTAEEAERVIHSLGDAGVDVRPEGAHGGGVAPDPWGTAVEVIAGSDRLSSAPTARRPLA